MWTDLARRKVDQYIELCQASGGCVVVDPNTGAVIAAGMDTVELTNHPLHHTAGGSGSKDPGWWCLGSYCGYFRVTVDTPGLSFTPADTLPSRDSELC